MKSPILGGPVLGLFTIVLASVLVNLLAQSAFGSVRSTKTDQTGAVLPGTQVMLHSVDENTDLATASDDEGNFAFENVKPGHFMLTASQQGFAKAIVDHLELAARQTLRVDVKLEVAAHRHLPLVCYSAPPFTSATVSISS